IRQEVHCGDLISYENIDAIELDCECENCNDVMARALILVQELPESFRSNAVMYCRSRHFSLKFVAGDGQRNKAFVMLYERQVKVRLRPCFMEGIKAAVARNWFPLVVVMVPLGVAGAVLFAKKREIVVLSSTRAA
ncbi:Hypothetical predicted protein, partial [Paramuricea clavata]